MVALVVLVLLGPAETVSGKYYKHSAEFSKLYPAPPVALPEPLPDDVDSLCRLIEAGHATPRLYAALGEALFARGDKRLAYRAFDKAHRIVEGMDAAQRSGQPDARGLVARKDACPHVDARVIRAEEREAKIWVDALQSFERARIRKGKDPRDLAEFHERYGRPEDSLAAIVRARRMKFLLGAAAVMLGLVAVCVVAVAIARKRRRA